MKITVTGIHIHDGEQMLVVDTNRDEWLNIEPQEDCMGEYMNVVSNIGSIWILRDSFKIETEV